MRNVHYTLKCSHKVLEYRLKLRCAWRCRLDACHLISSEFRRDRFIGNRRFELNCFFYRISADYCFAFIYALVTAINIDE